VSRAQAKRFGFDNPADVIGKTDADIFTAEHAQRALEEERQIIETGQPIIARIQKLTWPDRAPTWVSTTKMPLCDNAGRTVGTFGISRDITELKRLEEDLRTARDAADAASRAKGDFLANVSHEIRTPMNAIIGITELLLDTEISPTQREYLRMVQESGESLLNLLNDILDFSKIEAGRLELDSAPFELREALGDTLKSLGLRAHKKGLELAFSIDSNVPHMLQGDLGRLRQVVVNLIGNAIKFTEQGEVVLDVRCPAQSDGIATLEFAVSDTGIGIPADKQSRIFEAFEQADTSTTRNYGGTGLGLAICSRLVELMGGRIGVHSEVGQGSKFWFTAKLRVVDGPASELERRAVVVSDTPALIVDDNATNRRILFDMLSNWGMKPAVAASARDGFKQLQEASRRGQRFKIVLSDVNMPEVDGFEFASWIRDDASLAGTQIVMLTSAGRPGDADRRASLKIAGNLLKPVKQSELFDAMVTALGVNAADDEHRTAIAGETQPQRFEGLRVLLAEDNAVNQKLALGVLGKLGCHVTIAENGQQAVAIWDSQPFDVVLMDVQMPELDGMAATGAIRKREEFTGRHTPIVAMTAHAMTGDRDRCLAAGMDDYLSKPVRIRQLSEKLSEVLGRKDSMQIAASEATLPEKLVDWNEVLEGVGEDRELLQTVLEAYFAEAPSLLAQIERSIAAGDAAALRKSAHTLKGVLLAVGAHRTSHLAYELETTGDLARAARVFQLVQRQSDVLATELRAGPP
jgi:two-component system sensor histidine kinase/response regulator